MDQSSDRCPVEMLCTCKKDKPKRRSRQGSECSRSPSSPPDERDCFHKFQQHVDKIKKFAPQRQWGTITGVPLEGSTRIPEFDHSDHSTAKQLTAAIQIGAEAERRQEMKIEKLQEELDGVIELNDSLLEELRQRDGDISLLKGDICKNRQENECLQRSINILQDQSKSIEKDIESLEEENIKLKDVNEKLRREADKVRKELDDLQMCHKLCLSEQETKAFNEELRILKFQLNQALDKNAIHQEKIDTFKEKNSMMNVEVFNLNKQLEQERQKQCDISSSYKQKINELKHQIDVLEFELERLKEELEIKFQIESKLNREIEHLKQKSDLKKYEEEANLTIIDQLSEIIKTQEKEIKKLLNNNNDIQLTKKIGEVSSEVSCKGEERYNTRSLLDQNTTQLKESEPPYAEDGVQVPKHVRKEH
ncbi:hypothetical protein AAG570_000399 [Ranatra chinensis]|uniref:Uncharacterized protein n=1 Tax=Ranatra chinensis TaxID=642074 RepID=A0ABD0Z9M7_9HEMI